MLYHGIKIKKSTTFSSEKNSFPISIVWFFVLLDFLILINIMDLCSFVVDWIEFVAGFAKKISLIFLCWEIL